MPHRACWHRSAALARDRERRSTAWRARKKRIARRGEEPWRLRGDTGQIRVRRGSRTRRRRRPHQNDRSDTDNEVISATLGKAPSRRAANAPAFSGRGRDLLARSRFHGPRIPRAQSSRDLRPIRSRLPAPGSTRARPAAARNNAAQKIAAIPRWDKGAGPRNRCGRMSGHTMSRSWNYRPPSSSRFTAFRLRDYPINFMAPTMPLRL